MSKSPFSIMTGDMTTCYRCGSRRWIEIHHIFGGSNRNTSTEYGFIVPLCHYCHNEPPDGVHHNKKNSDALKRVAQAKFEREHSREDFIKLIGRNYL